MIEGYPAKINWEKVGYPTEFVVIITATTNGDVMREIERRHIAACEEYREKTGASSTFVIPVSEDGGKVILKDVMRGGEMPVAIVTGVASDNWAAKMFAEYYLSDRYPGIDTTLLIIQRSSIRNFEFQDEFIKAVIPMIFNNGGTEAYRDAFREEFRWYLLKPNNKLKILKKLKGEL